MNIYRIKHILPLAFVLILAITVYLLGFSNHLSLATLRQEEHVLCAWAISHPTLTAMLLFAVYVLSICLLIPASTLLTLFAGIIYPLPYAIFLSVLAETAGGCILFFILQFAFSSTYLHRDPIQLRSMKKQFHKNPACYLLFLRFSHLTPSWLITTAAAILKTSFWTFVWTTIVGALPLSYLIVSASKEIQKKTSSLSTWDWHQLFTTNTKLFLLSLGLMALIPIFIQKWIKR